MTFPKDDSDRANVEAAELEGLRCDGVPVYLWWPRALRLVGFACALVLSPWVAWLVVVVCAGCFIASSLYRPRAVLHRPLMSSRLVWKLSAVVWDSGGFRTRRVLHCPACGGERAILVGEVYACRALAFWVEQATSPELEDPTVMLVWYRRAVLESSSWWNPVPRISGPVGGAQTHWTEVSHGCALADPN